MAREPLLHPAVGIGPFVLKARTSGRGPRSTLPAAHRCNSPDSVSHEPNMVVTTLAAILMHCFVNSVQPRTGLEWACQLRAPLSRGMPRPTSPTCRPLDFSNDVAPTRRPGRPLTSSKANTQVLDFGPAQPECVILASPSSEKVAGKLAKASPANATARRCNN